MKDKIHIILYFLNLHEERIFYKLEYLILDEILEHKSSKIIYVVTHSNPNITEQIKKSKKEQINSAIKDLINKYKKENEKNSENSENSLNKYELLYASLDNIVFVNFHKDTLNGPKFGEKDLFNKIHDFFIKSDDYNHFSKLNIEEEAQRMQIEAREALLSNKIWGGVVGIIPGVDWALQNSVIKKIAVKKVGEIFGINIEFINKETINGYSNFQNHGGLGGILFGTSLATTETISIGAAIAGIGIAAAGCIIGVGLGWYFTCKFCNEILDKFDAYYRNNGKKIKNSYEMAASYFSE